MKEVLWSSVSSDQEAEEYFYMQDWAPPHCVNAALKFLEEKLKLSNHVISRRSQRCWPARSPDLGPLDFLVWGYLDSKSAEKNPATIEDVMIIVEEEFRNVTPGTLRRVCFNFGKRITKCLQKNRDLFEAEL